MSTLFAHQQKGHASSFGGVNSSNVMSHLSVSQVRELYAQALSEAEAKRTELKIVVTSRYKELVGSSDEVQTMQQCAKELFDKVSSLPTLLEKVNSSNDKSLEVAQKLLTPSMALAASTSASTTASTGKGGRKCSNTLAQLIQHSAQEESNLIYFLRKRLAMLTRRIHRAVDRKDPHVAALALVETLSWIAIHDAANNGVSDIRYPMARVVSVVDPQEFQHLLHISDNDQQRREQHVLLATQVHMTYLQLQSLPLRTIRMAQAILRNPATHADASAGALLTLPLLDPTYRISDASSKLLDLYYDSKSNLLSQLLETLEAQQKNTHQASKNDEDISHIQDLVQQLQTIVAVLQQDLILHSNKIFLYLLSSSLGYNTANSSDNVATGGMETGFDPKIVKAKCSRFLAAHLPMIANRLRNILSSINTAAHLATIRQVLYQQTNTDIDHDQWNCAVQNVVDLRVVLHTKDVGTSSVISVATTRWTPSTDLSTTPTTTSTGTSTTQFSLWSILFSQTFDSLVENLLRHSCVSLHNNLISTLRRSLALAPAPATRIKPHEAYRNCMNIVLTLDNTLAQLADDAWKLVHSEERHVSSVALRQSLFVQTCETMARLLCELRLLVSTSDKASNEDGDGQEHNTDTINSGNVKRDAGKELIVARLCYLLKYRLKSLQTLLDPSSAPWCDSSSATRQQMITFEELQSAFEIADDDDDGILSLHEASEALEMAFSGSNFGGAHIISTLKHEMNPSNAPVNVTLPELALLTARGIKYEVKPKRRVLSRKANQDQQGSRSEQNHALRTIQSCLDSILTSCWNTWAKSALVSATRELELGCSLFCQTSNISGDEWLRLHGGGGDGATRAGRSLPSTISSYIMAYLLAVSMEFHRVVCPKDFLLPVDTIEEAEALGIPVPDRKAHGHGQVLPPTLVVLIRQALLCQALRTFHYVLASSPICSPPAMKEWSDPCLLQILLDVGFFQYCMEQCTSLQQNDESLELLKCLQKIAIEATICLSARMDIDDVREKIGEMYPVLYSSCVLFLSSLLGQDSKDQSKAADGVVGLSSSFGRTVATDVGVGVGVGGSTLTPLLSSRRFVLLPIQSERQLKEIVLQASRNARPRSAASDNTKISDYVSKSGSASSSFGFFTSMTTKWKK